MFNAGGINYCPLFHLATNFIIMQLTSGDIWRFETFWLTVTVEALNIFPASRIKPRIYAINFKAGRLSPSFNLFPNTVQLFFNNSSRLIITCSPPPLRYWVGISFSNCSAIFPCQALVPGIRAARSSGSFNTTKKPLPFHSSNTAENCRHSSASQVLSYNPRILLQPKIHHAWMPVRSHYQKHEK